MSPVSPDGRVDGYCPSAGFRACFGQSEWLDRVPAHFELRWRRSQPGIDDGSLYLHDGIALLGWLDGVATSNGDLTTVDKHATRGRRHVLSILHPEWREDGRSTPPR